MQKCLHVAFGAMVEPSIQYDSLHMYGKLSNDTLRRQPTALSKGRIRLLRHWFIQQRLL